MEDSPARGIPFLHFDSDVLPAADRFEAWRTAIGPIHETSQGESEGPGGFRVATTVWNLGEMVAAHGRYSAQRSERSATLIRRSGANGYRLVVSLGGPPFRLATGDDRRVAGTGDLVATDMRQPSIAETIGTTESIAFYLSRPAVDALLPRSARPDLMMLNGPLAALLRDHLASLVGLLRASATPAEAAPGLAQATLHLFAAALSGTEPAGGEGRGAVEDALRRRITGFIEERLLDPALTQDLLCRSFHMSRATLYRLFQPLGGVAAFVQERRLARVRAALLDPAHHHHLGRLAETHGFSSQAQMSRAYKARYGTSPSDTHGAVVPTPVAETDGDTIFRRWVRGLGD